MPSRNIVAAAAYLAFSFHASAQERACKGALANPILRKAGDIFAGIALQKATAYEATPNVIFETTSILRDFRRDARVYAEQSTSIDIWKKPKNDAAKAFHDEADATLLSCFPDLVAAVENIRAKEAELKERLADEARERERIRKEAIQRREAQEAKRQAEEAEEREQARQQQDDLDRKLAEAARRQARQDAIEMQPARVLSRAYGYYIFIKRCYEARQGYFAIFISGQEIERARSEVQAISTKIKASGAVLDDDGAWKLANSFADNGEIDRDTCQATLALLDRVARLADPDGSMTRKDFP